jgi:putative flavoprotein involved in K+ transport
MLNYDCVIIGAGQSGLYAAHLLNKRGISYIALERDQIGQIWHNRWKSMRLFTSRQFCGLPGLPFPGDPNGFPTANEMGDYLKVFAHTFKVSTRENSEVVSLTKEQDRFIVTLKDGDRLSTKSVINATGSNQVPHIPSISTGLSDDVLQLDGTLQSLTLVPEGSRVVVVGDGATGRQIAGGLASVCKVTLSTGKSRGLPPGTILGKDIFWWLNKIGILVADKRSVVAKILQRRNPVPCGNFNNRNLKKMGVRIVRKAQDCSGQTVFFEQGESADADVVIWSTGYRDHTDWLKLPHCINEAGFIEEYGITPEPGLFVLGRKWLSCRASELVMGLPKDAEYVISAVEKHLKTSINPEKLVVKK